MKKNIFLCTLTLITLFSFQSCSNNDDDLETVQNPEPLNLDDYNNGSGVMLQAFYWDVEPRFEWWANLSDKVKGWADAGINRIWLPPASKGQSGGYSMGYDPSDYYDFGEYNQQGTIPTRFGTREELENLIEKAHENNLEVIADIVINHNSGGGLEYNPYRDKDTYTLFDEEHGNASGMFNRNYEDFYPNSVSGYSDDVLFYEETNLDHHREHVQNWLWKKDNSVAKYYKNVMGFDGWRFDYVRGYEAWVVADWMDAVGGFAVAENWTDNTEEIENWIKDAGVRAFDFPCLFRMDEAFDRYNNLTYLNNDMLRKVDPDMAVTFVANHDTEKDENENNRISAENKLKAYAYILTHDGYPCVFYSDYENEDFQQEIKNLIAIHNSLATGDVEVLYADENEYIMKRDGDDENPGLILYISTSSSKRKRVVDTNWKTATLMDYSGHSSEYLTTNEDGKVTLEVPANTYSIWSVTQ